MDAVSRAVTQVRRALGSQPRAPADSLIRAAEENLELVRVGKGAHNIPFADELLRAAVSLAREAAEAGGANPRPGLGEPGPTHGGGVLYLMPLRCGRGGVVTWQGRSFPHRRHTVNAGFDCQACHTPMSEHGGLTLASTATCDNCHHISDSPQACGFCHDAPAGDTLAFAGQELPPRPPPRHGIRVQHLPSGSLHGGAGGELCDGCHSLHHTPTTNCLLCHDGAPQDNGGYVEVGSFPHDPHAAMGLTCATCH